MAFEGSQLLFTTTPMRSSPPKKKRHENKTAFSFFFFSLRSSADCNPYVIDLPSSFAGTFFRKKKKEERSTPLPSHYHAALRFLFRSG